MLPWSDPARWRSLWRGDGCPLCASDLSDVIADLPTARVRVPSSACLSGYVCVILRRHVPELHELPAVEAAAFIEDVSRVSAAAQGLTGAVKINLLSIGNLVPHLHVHVCPRRPGDRVEGRALDPGDVSAEIYRPGEHAAYVERLREALARPSPR